MPNLNNQVSPSAIAFIDTQVENYQSLIAGVKPGTEVVVLDRNRDAIDQITQILRTRTNIDSIHIVSHGAPGSLQLGDGSVSLDDIEGDRDSLQQWFSPRTYSTGKNRPNLLLYGCCVAAGQTGKAFVKRLSELTGAVVAASENLTGSVAKGGDWELEVRTGKIETPLVFEAEVLAGYEYVLNTFGAATNFPITYSLRKVATGDFNKDGNLDLAFATTGTNRNVSIALGDGTGQFSAATNLNTSPPNDLETWSVAVGDFNNDGNSDLVTANNATNNVSLLLGNGDGTFGAATYFGVGSTPYGVAVADFNGDGNLDLATANSNSKNVSILPGNGNGTFGAATNLSVGSYPYFVFVADFNKDGKPDLATANYGDSSVSILLQNANGTFGAATEFTVGDIASDIAIADFNGDNNPDLATSNENSNNVSILLGNGTGSFSTATNFDIGTAPFAIATGDFNADGKLDLATANNGSGDVSVLFGSGNGSFGTATNFVVGTEPQGIVVGDFNLDGLSDLATANFGSQNTSILLNTSFPAVNFGGATESATEGTADTVVNIPVTLSATPDADVTVPIVIDPNSSATENSDYTFSPTSITFPAGATGAALTQNVAFTIKPDNFAENAETAILNFGTIIGGVAGTTKKTTLTIAANGTVSYAIAAGTASIAEGNSGTTPLTFTANRSGDTGGASSVNYTIASTATNVSDYNNIGGTSGATAVTGTINFGAGETSKTITLDVLGDRIVEPDETIAVTLSSPTGPGLTPTITAATATTTITNDDVAGFTVNPVSGLTTSEVGGVAEFTVKLNAQPTADVTIGLTSDNTAEGRVSTNSLTFTDANYNQPQTITVSGVDDLVADGPIAYKIFTAAAVSSDANYNNLDPDDVTLTNSDNETPGITVNPTAGLTTGESGSTANFTVVLNTQPTADVTIGLNSDNVAEGTVSTNDLTFTPANWNTPQQVTVTGVEDSIADGDIDYKIVTGAAVSTDANYSNLDVADVSLSNQDNDTAGVSITPTQTTAAEGGANGSYRIQLTSQPRSPVTITLTTGNQIGDLAPLTFTADNWNIAQTVTVQAVDDTVVEGAHSVNITHTVSSTDTKYNGLVVPGVTVAIADNDVAPPPPPPTPTPMLTPTTGTPTPTPTPTTGTPTPTPTPTTGTPTPTPTPTTGTPTPTPTPTTGTPTPTPTPTTGTPTPTPVTTETGGTNTFPIAIPSSNETPLGITDSNALIAEVGDPTSVFTDTNVPISGLGLDSAIWGDYNNDGKLDILGNSKIYDNTRIYDNNSQSWNEYGFSEFGRDTEYNLVSTDYDNNGWLDATRLTNNGNNTFKYEIYSGSDDRYGGEKFTLDAVLANNLSSGIVRSSWADYNNDGRSDLLLSTQGSYIDDPIVTTLYRNTKPVMYQDRFQDSKARLDTGEPLFSTSEIAGATSSGVWADYDNDGKLDILIKVRESEQTQSGGQRQKAKLYRNLGDGVFQDTAVSLPDLGLEFPRFDATVYDMAWGDYDNDGKLDILLTGAMDGANGSSQLFTKVYRNTTSTNGSASFEDIGAQIPGLSQAKAAWGDYDNDGKLDILVTGWERQDFASPGTSVTKVYRNTGNGFTDSGVQIDSGAQPGNTYSSTPAWGDYDKDGKLDILLTGYSTNNPWRFLYDNDSFTKVFRNNTPNANTPPTPPALLPAEVSGRDVTFKWNRGTDEQTPDLGLSYNLRVVSTSGGADILSPMSLSDGTRQLVGLGNVSQNTQWQLKDLPRGTYEWGVQAIDTAWAGSRFATGGTFRIENSPPEQKIRLGGRYTELNQPIKDVYTDADGDQIWYQLTLEDGTPLPSSDSNTNWLGLQSDPWQNTITFIGTPPSGSQPFKVKLIATDYYGASSEQTFKVTTKEGRWVIDGYISGATVFLDTNKNGVKDTNEPSTITDSSGKFNLDIPFETFDTNKNGEIDPSEGNLVATGGIDTATGLPLETPVTAPPDSSVVTLLTSLIADLTDKGIAPESAQSLVKAALGLPAEVDLTSLDPIEATNNNQPGGVQVLAAMVKVQNFITQTAALIDGASSAASYDLVKAVVSSITNQIQSGTVLNLSNAAALEPIIQQAAAKIQQIDPSFNSQTVTQITSQAATVMATANQRVDAAVSNPRATSIPESLARLQQVALGPTTQDFKQVGTGNKPISQVVADNTGTALDSRIEAVVLPAGIATPVVSGDADLGSNSPNAIVGTNGDDILSGDSANNVLMGMRGNDALDGGMGNDSVFGGKGSDTLLGSSGDDALFGNRGADILNGDDGNDILYGGKGDDLLTGGLGIDTLTGGMGVDKFLLSTNSGTDTITDFEVGKDLLVLGNGLSFSQLTIAQDSGATLIRFAQTGEILASLSGVSAIRISAVNFGLI
jgi:hypothetical protein